MNGIERPRAPFLHLVGNGIARHCA
jgi:hypothetical protein